LIAGVSQLKFETIKTIKTIQENVGNLAMVFDFNGTLVPAGVGMDEKTVGLISSLVNVLEGAVALNTAQATSYMASRGGDVFPAKSFELGLWVEYVNGQKLLARAPDFIFELKSIQKYLQERPDENFTLVVKNGGFAVKFTDEDGRLAKGADIDAVVRFVRDLVEGKPELIAVETDGFIDLCSRELNSDRYSAPVG
jgi:hypothetical protein